MHRTGGQPNQVFIRFIRFGLSNRHLCAFDPRRGLLAWTSLVQSPETARNPLSGVSMSVNSLLSFVPFVRRRVPPAQDMDSEAASGAAMIIRALNLLAVVWELMLLVSAAVLVVFALLTPKVAFFHSTNARDTEIHSIKSVIDVGLLQNKAVWEVSKGYSTGATATFLCHLALGTLLFMIIGSIGGLLLIRWMKRHLTPNEDAT